MIGWGVQHGKVARKYVPTWLVHRKTNTADLKQNGKIYVNSMDLTQDTELLSSILKNKMMVGIC